MKNQKLWTKARKAVLEKGVVAKHYYSEVKKKYEELQKKENENERNTNG